MNNTYQKYMLYAKTENPLSKSVKNILNSKSNYTNTINKFYKEDVELVRKLDFFQPLSYEADKAKKSKNKTNAGKSSNKLKQIEMNIQEFNMSGDIEALKTDSSFDSKNNEGLPSILNNRVVNFSSLNTEGGKKVLHNNINLKRLENLGRESNMETEKGKLQTQMTNLKYDKKLVTSQLLALQREIDRIEIDLELVDNFSTVNNINIRKLENLKNSRRQTIEDKDLYHLAITQVQKDKDKRDQMKTSLENELERKRELKAHLKSKMDGFNTKLENLRTKYNELKTNLIMHYHLLMKEGRDTRSEGLVWVLKAIWSLGCNVIISYMPNFLDEAAIDFLFQAAHQDVELQNLKIEIDDLKVKMRLGLPVNRYRRRGRKFTQLFKTDATAKKAAEETLQNSKLINKTDTNALNPENANFKNIEDYLNTKEKLDELSLSIFKKISEIDGVYDRKRKDLIAAKRTELNRLSREFLVNDYQRRYNVSLKTVVSAISGEDNINTEMVRQNRDQREYFDKLKHVRYFNFFEDHQKN